MKNNRRAGYMLIEVLAVASILAIVLGLAGQILLSCTRLSTYGTRAADRIEQAAEVEDAFRAAVREAFAVSPGVGNYRGGADTLVLETPSTGGRRYVVLGRIRDAGHLTVLKLAEKEGTLDSDYMSTQALPIQTLGFTYDSDDPAAARRVTLRFEAKGPGKAAESREVAVALGAIARQETRHE